MRISQPTDCPRAVLRHILFTAMLLSFPQSARAEPLVLDLRTQAQIRDGWLEHRTATLLPDLMRRADIDLWVIAGREYNEDPVLQTFLPATWLSARRRTVLLIHDPGADQPLETLAVARYDVGRVFRQSWDPETEPDQWRRTAALIAERNPRKIGINTSADFALADGLTHSEHQALTRALGPELSRRLTGAQSLAVGWLETRTAEEMIVYRQICAIAHEIIREGFSRAAVQPGVTTTEDLVWWFRERVRARGLSDWFHPSVSVQRAEDETTDHRSEVLRRTRDGGPILPGDLLHVDFGITYLGLNTDTQQHAYVLRDGENTAPPELRDALKVGNRLQDILTGEFTSGRTGNQILQAALDKAARENIVASIYTHPIGYHGHAAGPTIGMWDQQQGVPGSGDYPLYPNTAYSIELYAEHPVASWKRTVRIKLEEDAFFDGTSVRYIDGRQTELLLIGN